MKPGNTTAMPVSASVPSFDTHQVSISPVEACASITSRLGQANLSSVETIGACSSILVRGFISGAAVAAMIACGASSFMGCRPVMSRKSCASDAS